MRPRAIVFDLYGTLLRIDALTERVASHGIAQAEMFVERWRAKQIEYAWCSSLMGQYRDFDTLTRRALTYALDAAAVTLSAQACADLADAWQSLDAYADVAPVLAQLQSGGIPLAVLTNGVQASAEQALRFAGIRPAFSAVISVESVGAYKPDPRVYRLATSHFTCAPTDIVFVSSNGWDAAGAAAFGLRVAWCNRHNRPPEALGFAPESTLTGLAELPSFLADGRS